MSRSNLNRLMRSLGVGVAASTADTGGDDNLP